MRVPPNVIFIWSGANASIPDGYTRKTDLDSRYPKGTAIGVAPNVTGGATTHTHTSPAHIHAMVNHTHSINITNIDNKSDGADDVRNSATDHDNHAGTPYTSGARSGGGLSSVASTYSAYSNHPPYYEVIYINSDGSCGVPDDVIALFDTTTLPTNWKNCDGNNATPDFGDKYLKGAGVGADAGGTGGGYINTHNLVHSSNHTVANHTHVAITSGAANRFSQKSSGAGDDVNHNHTHSISLNTKAVAIQNNTPTLVTDETIEPLYAKLMAIQNQNGQDSVPKGIIGMWTGALGDIPPGWSEVASMRGRHLKIAQNSGEIGNTGGSNAHIHQGDAHTHTATGSHDHVASGMGHVQSVNASGSENNAVQYNDTHTYTVSSTIPTWVSTATSANSSDNQPPFRTVSFIKLVQTADAGFLLNFI